MNLKNTAMQSTKLQCNLSVNKLQSQRTLGINSSTHEFQSAHFKKSTKIRYLNNFKHKDTIIT